LLCFGPIPAIVAIVLGLSALSQIKKNPDHAGGQSQARAGIIIGGVALVIHGAIWIFYIALIVLGAANH
jgi:predicted acyltransferase